jgi:hypothetical protein
METDTPIMETDIPTTETDIPTTETDIPTTDTTIEKCILPTDIIPTETLQEAMDPENILAEETPTIATPLSITLTTASMTETTAEVSTVVTTETTETADLSITSTQELAAPQMILTVKTTPTMAWASWRINSVTRSGGTATKKVAYDCSKKENLSE